MKEFYNNIQSFVEDIHKESVKQIILDMGYLTIEQFIGSKVNCPFHKETIPSMQITDNFFKCYGCNSKGDIIQFIRIHDSLTFIEAVLKLAEHFNVNIKNKDISIYLKMQKELQTEWEYYINEFNKIVAKKNNKAATIKELGQRFFPQIIGYDPKIDYIVLPFTSKTNNILGFTKRIIDDSLINTDINHPKWKHSNMKYTLISHCHNIYNLGRAFKHIKEKCEVNIVEGPGDVSSMERAGFKNTIAICGTSNFSKEILSLLSPLKIINFWLDNDKAGFNASINNILMLMSINAQLCSNASIVQLPEEKDPGDLTQDELIECFANKQNALYWFINNASDENIKKLYLACKSTIIKPKIVNILTKAKNFSPPQAEEWLNLNLKINNEENDYYQRLLATIGECKDINIEPLNMNETQARKILKFRYKYKNNN